jgi:PKD repeat protein
MGDGTEAEVTTENRLNHTYVSPGLFTIKLTVSDGDSETTEEHIINVVEPPKTPGENSNTGVVIAGVVFGVIILLLFAVLVFIFISRSRQQPPPPPPGMPPAIPPKAPTPGLYAKPAQGLPPPRPSQPPSNLPPPPVHP